MWRARERGDARDDCTLTAIDPAALSLAGRQSRALPEGQIKYDDVLFRDAHDCLRAAVAMCQRLTFRSKYSDSSPYALTGAALQTRAHMLRPCTPSTPRAAADCACWLARSREGKAPSRSNQSGPRAKARSTGRQRTVVVARGG